MASKVRPDTRREPQWEPGDDGHLYCQHGTADDVHCCNCHSGCLFNVDDCTCEFDCPSRDSREQAMEERTLRWFEYMHLPEHLRPVSAIFGAAAHSVVEATKPGPERTVALRKLLEAKDAAVRQAIEDRG